ncbi:MAG: SRPBCC family protein [Nitrolancea sp.]
MTRIHLETHIAASIQRCFDLARSVDVHQQSMEQSGERAVSGVTSGLMELGDSVTWEAKHLGFTRRLTSKITNFDPPQGFVDAQVSGPFAYFTHTHGFIAIESGTLMTDDFDYGVPFGPLGAIGNRLILAGYMRRLLQTRNAHIKHIAESDEPRS